MTSPSQVESDAAYAIERMAGQLANHPKSQYVRLNRWEAEALVADARREEQDR